MRDLRSVRRRYRLARTAAVVGTVTALALSETLPYLALCLSLCAVAALVPMYLLGERLDRW